MPFSLQATANALEARLRATHLLDLPVPWADELVYPAYAGLSLRNIPHTVAALLGAPLPGSTPLDAAVWGDEAPDGTALADQVERVVVVLTDGLAYRWLVQFMQEDPALADLVGTVTGGRGPVPLTSISPSTTSAALSTLWTGATPAAHGMTGYRVYLREIAMLAIPLFFRPALGNQPNGSLEAYGLNPETFLPVPSLIDHLAAAGVPSYAFLRNDFINTGLSRIIHRGLPPEGGIPHVNHADMWLRLRELLTRTAGQRCYVNVYWEGVDTISHAYGSGNDYVRAEVRDQMAGLAQVLTDPAVQDGRTLVLITADHGHYDAPRTIDFQREERAAPIWNAMQGLVSGEQRLGFLHLRAGQRQTVIDCVEGEFADVLTWIDPAEALAAGLFGPEPPCDETIHRLGDLILIPRLGTRVDDGVQPPGHPLISVHGGLSDWEMLTPLLWNRV